MEKRQSNFELLRIVCMVLIVGIHITGQTNMDEYVVRDGISYYYCVLIGSAGRLVCNTFVMIGAWFLVDSKPKPEKAINLWLEIFFYSVAITLMCLITGCGDANIITFVQACFPVFGRPVWFGAEYICLLLLTPWLNEMLNKNNWQRTKKVIKLFGLLIIGCATIFPIEHTTPAFSELVWFCFLYLFTGLYKHYQILTNRRLEKYSFWLFSLGYLFLCGTKILADVLDIKVLQYLYVYYRGHYEALPGFACSLFLFLAFKNLDTGYNKVINIISRSTFAVYIMHQTPAFYQYMWNGIFQVDDIVRRGGQSIVGYSLLVIIVIFVACVCIDNVRLWVMETFISKSKAYNRLCERIRRYY